MGAQDSNANTKGITGWNKTQNKTAPATPEQKFSRVDLDPVAFDRLIKQKGVKVKVYLTGYCSNVKSIDAAEHEIDCPYCNGSGFLDIRPIECLAFIQNQSLEGFQGVEGTYAGNTVAITFPSGIELQFFTLIELCDFNEIYFQRVARSETQVDVLKYRAKRINFVECLGAQYYEGSHFCINQDGNIKWHEDKGPEAGKIYSIHYESAVQFRATQAMHSNRFTQVLGPGGTTFLKLPEQWACTKEFLVRRKGINGQDLQPNPIPHYDTVIEED